MTLRIFAYVTHKDGVADDSAAEILAAAGKIDPTATVTAVVTGYGPELDMVSEKLRSSYAEVWKVASESLSYPNAELIRQALVTILPAGSLVLLPHNHFGIDLGPGLSIKLNAAFLSDVVGIDGRDGAILKVVRQEFGGQISAHVVCDLSTGAVINLRPGAFKPGESVVVAGSVVDKSPEVGMLTARRRYVQTVVAEAGDIDISKERVLVSIGRGIQEQENVALAEDLAEALGAVVSCSRPVVDAKWLPRSRQVGSSGQTVKPKIYLACGMSGSFQHLAGIKGNPFLVAINKNPKAPIFQVADVGIVADILEFLPELTSKVRELRGAAAKAH
jgi:electron transfer flavoprotein alpha subunit